MTDFCETLDLQLQVKLTLEQNMIETNRFFLQKQGVNTIELSIKRDPVGSENVKNGGQQSGSPPSCSSMGEPPGGGGGGEGKQACLGLYHCGCTLLSNGPIGSCESFMQFNCTVQNKHLLISIDLTINSSREFEFTFEISRCLF